MAKGIPLMGRDPDGKAKIINVDENGNVKVQQVGNDIVIGLLADRPPASEMRGRGYYAWDAPAGQKLTYSNGTTWVVNQ